MRRATALLTLLVGAAICPLVSAEPSSYSRESDGSKVLYLFLDDLGYQVSRSATLDALEPRPGKPAVDAVVILGTAKARVLNRAARWAREKGKLLLYAAPLFDAESQQRCAEAELGELRVPRRFRVQTKELQKSAPFSDLSLRRSACLAQAPREANILAKLDDGALVFAHQLGQGKLLFFAHDDLLRNLYLDRDDLAVLLRRWLQREAPTSARIVFYEERQGGKLWEMLARANMVPLLAHSLVLLLLIYWRVSPRFGDPTAARPPGRRAFAEHARALGGLYQRAGASGYALHQLYQRFLERMRMRDRGQKGHGAEREQLADRLATRSGRPVEKVRALLLQVEHAAAMKGAKDKTAAAEDFRLGRALAQLAGEAEGRRDEKRSAS